MVGTRADQSRAWHGMRILHGFRHAYEQYWRNAAVTEVSPRNTFWPASTNFPIGKIKQVRLDSKVYVQMLPEIFGRAINDAKNRVHQQLKVCHGRP